MPETVINATGERIERPASVGVPSWFHYHPHGRVTGLVFIECASCGRCSRNVKAPTEGNGVNPDEPRGWTDVCPDCQSPAERTYVKAVAAAMRRARATAASSRERRDG
jgi:hypothetical protein